MILNRKLIALSFVVFSFFILYSFSLSDVFTANSSQFSNLITVDVLITIPFVYFLFIRKTRISNLTVIPITIFGVVLASFVLPEENQSFLNGFKTWVLPLIELLIFGFVLLKVSKTISSFKAKRKVNTDFYTVLKKTCSENFTKFIANALATEIAVFYYAFINWNRTRLQLNEFSYHKKSGALGLYIAFILIIATETVGLHVLLSKSNPTMAWILTGLSIYTIIQIIGFVKSIFKRPIVVNGNKLLLRYGIMKEADIDLKAVLAVEISSREIPKNSRIKFLSLSGTIESYNFIIHFKTKQIVSGLYGTKKTVESIALSIDKPEDFKAALKKAKNTISAVV